MFSDMQIGMLVGLLWGCIVSYVVVKLYLRTLPDRIIRVLRKHLEQLQNPWDKK